MVRPRPSRSEPVNTDGLHESFLPSALKRGCGQRVSSRTCSALRLDITRGEDGRDNTERNLTSAQSDLRWSPVLLSDWLNATSLAKCPFSTRHGCLVNVGACTTSQTRWLVLRCYMSRPMWLFAGLCQADIYKGDFFCCLFVCLFVRGLKSSSVMLNFVFCIWLSNLKRESE